MADNAGRDQSREQSHEQSGERVAHRELPQTPSQTVGPFFHNGLILGGENVLVSQGVAGQRIILTGTVTDGNGEPIPDAMIEIWQPDAAGIFAHPADERSSAADPAFRGFGRAPTDGNGVYRFETVKPGGVPNGDGGLLTPQVNVHVFARGMLIHAFTRMFFADEPGNDDDPTLTQVPADRRATLLAVPDGEQNGERNGVAVYRFDVRMQGDGETVFFEP